MKGTSGRSQRSVVRIVGGLILAMAAIGVYFGMAPHSTTTASEISSALLDDSINQKAASGAPQQSVVNGWTARDLLTIIARQGGQRDDRPVALLTLVVLGLGLAVGTSFGQLGSSTDPGVVPVGGPASQPLDTSGDPETPSTS